MSESSHAPKQERALARWRDDLSTKMLRAIAAPALAAVLGIIRESIQPTSTPIQRQLALFYTAVFFVLLAFAWFKNIRYAVRASVILVFFFGLGLLSLFIAGLSSNGRLFMLITPMLATIFLGSRAGVAMLVLCLTTMAAFGWGLTQGAFSLLSAEMMMSNDVWAWTRTVAIHALLCLSVLVPLVHLLRGQMFAVELGIKNAELEEAQTRTQAAMERAKGATRAKSAFVANMSHELRTPLNGVLGMTELLLSSKLEAEQQELAKTLQGSSEALLSIINDILDFSKIESGRLELERAPYNLQDCVEEALDLMAPTAQQKGIILLYEMTHDVPRTIEGDATRVRQVLLNLLGNAVKFTESGEVRVSISLDAYLLKVQVVDTGIGIPQSRLGRLFEPFTQADASTTRNFGGTGLGLTISRQLVELMNGTIWVHSEVGRGSSFCFSIPIEVADEPSPPPTWSRGRKMQVLCSQPALQINLEARLDALGMVVDHPPEVIVTDTLAPEALATLREKYAAPVVMLTPFSGLAGLPWSAPPDGVPLLRMPVRGAQLNSCLRRALGVPEETQTQPEKTSLLSVRAPLRILLAEDNRVNQLVAQKMLALLGYQVDVVDNGAKAVEATARTRFDVVLMDVQMPELDGLQASERIRARAGEQPWIVAMTAHAQPQDRATCLAAGMNDYLSKPVRRSALEEALTKAAAHRPFPGEALPVLHP